MNLTPHIFLAFTPQNKRYSYAASFGVDRLPQKPDLLIPHYRHYLKQMNYISVREASGTRIVEELIGRKADVAPDPTLLLSKEEWQKELDMTVDKTGNFLLIYFVSEISPEIAEEIKKICKRKTIEYRANYG